MENIETLHSILRDCLPFLRGELRVRALFALMKPAPNYPDPVRQTEEETDFWVRAERNTKSI